MTSTPPLTEIMSHDWANALAGVEDRIHSMGDFLRDENAAGRAYLPAGDFVFRAFAEPLSEVKVLIVGQDPYPTPGHAIGLSFAVDPEVRPLPRSLGNIYKELESDLGIPPAQHGGPAGMVTAGSHVAQPRPHRLPRRTRVPPRQGVGGDHGTGDHRADRTRSAARRHPLGPRCPNLAPLLTSGTAEVAIIESAHPSPLSARRGFFGSRPFSRTNDLLAQKGIEPIDWALPDQV